MEPLFWIHLLLGPFVLVLVILFRLFPPKKINYLYGYRTPRSMRSQEAWDEGNRYSGKWLVWAATGTCLVQLTLWLSLGPEDSLLPTVFILLLAVLSVLPATEVRLRRRFPDRDPETSRD